MSQSRNMPNAVVNVSTEKKSRQRQGTACQDCRRRKLKCDGKTPSCTACIEGGLECEQTQFTSPRGPKRGHIKAIQSRLANLEQWLQLDQVESNESTTEVPPPSTASAASWSSSTAAMNIPMVNNTTMATTVANPASTLQTPPLDPMTLNSNPYTTMDTMTDAFGSCDSSLWGAPPVFLTNMVMADLDQIYFERAHPFVPIIHRRRYFSWARQDNKTVAQTCLQYAMWMLASCLSTQMQHMQSVLRDCMRYSLDELTNNDKCGDFGAIEHAQAQVLLPIYEFMRTDEQKGWMSAGHCFRLLQFMRLYEVDSPDEEARRKSGESSDEWLSAEERRRVFWMAYSLDRFISIRSERPLTLNESMIMTRLPASEVDYQNGNPAKSEFLSEAILSRCTYSQFPIFTESIILATICGRARAHGQQSSVEHVYTSLPGHFWERHDYIDGMLDSTIKNLQQNYPVESRSGDCMLVFSQMFALATRLYLCNVIESICWHSDEDQARIDMFRSEALEAAREIVSMSQHLRELSYFKMHPFTPLLLSRCSTYLQAHSSEVASGDTSVQELSFILLDIASMNNLAGVCLDQVRDTADAMQS